MILHTAGGAVVILNQNCWTAGAYLAVNSGGGGGGAMLTLEELDHLSEEIDRIRAAIAQRATPNQPERKRA